MQPNHCSIGIQKYLFPQTTLIFTMLRYASVVYSVIMFPSVCPSQAGIGLKPLNIQSCKQRHTIAQGLYFSDAKDLRKILLRSTPMRAPNVGGMC